MSHPRSPHFLSLTLCLHWLPIYFAPKNTDRLPSLPQILQKQGPPSYHSNLVQSMIKMPPWLLIGKSHHLEWLNAIPESHHPQ